MDWILLVSSSVLYYLVCATTFEADFGFLVMMQMSSTSGTGFKKLADKMVLRFDAILYSLRLRS